MNKEVADQLTRARTALILDHPFFGQLALRLRLIEDNTVPTLCVNGKVIRYNPDFVDGLSPALTRSALVHEVGHCVFEHIGRRNGRDPGKWNRAGDYVINAMIKDSGFEIGQSWLYNPAYAGMTTDEIYNLLPESDSQPGEPGGSMDEVKDGDPASTDVDATDWKIATIQAAAAAQAMGKLPASMKRFVDELTEPRVDWRDVLRRFVTEISKNDYTWMRPNKRYASQGINLPTMHSESMGHIVVAIDTSGSIGQDTLNAFGSEIKSIVGSVRPLKTAVIYCDSAVNHVDEFEPNDELHFEMHGGGGTDFCPPFALLEERSETPACFVYLTDMYGRFPSDPGYPVLWCATTDIVGPIGDTVRIEV